MPTVRAKMNLERFLRRKSNILAKYVFAMVRLVRERERLYERHWVWTWEGVKYQCIMRKSAVQQP